MLKKCILTNFRNFSNIELQFRENIIIIGDNAKGKTSILEAIYIAIHNKSFRTKKIINVIQNNKKSSQIFLSSDTHKIGIEINNERNILKMNGHFERNHSEITKLFPTKLLNQDSLNVLLGSPSDKRIFLNWGTFYNNQNFFTIWKNFQKVLKQRNAYLKLNNNDLDIFGNEFAKYANKLDQLRKNYIEELEPKLKNILNSLIPNLQIKLNYFRGWSKENDIYTNIQNNLNKDKKLGFTSSGPQKADLQIQLNGKNVTEIISRGQQKLLSIALHLSQISLLNKKIILLIDDLPSELDKKHREILFNILTSFNCQLFITSTSLDLLPDNFQNTEFINL